jgi:hypothetical protein
MSTHLDSLRDELAIAEGRLRNARDKLESAAKRYGEPLTGMFSDTFFIPRSTAERWLDNAERNFAEMQANLRTLAAKKADNDEDDDDDTGDRDDPDDQGDDTPTEPTDKGKKKTKKKPEATNEDVEAAEAAAARFFQPRDPGTSDNAARDAKTAAAIIAAGQKRRGEVPSAPDVSQRKPALTVVPGAKPPTDPVARGILNAGCKRRGEPDVF